MNILCVLLKQKTAGAHSDLKKLSTLAMTSSARVLEVKGSSVI
jgi:hypothetical protein